MGLDSMPQKDPSFSTTQEAFDRPKSLTVAPVLETQSLRLTSLPRYFRRPGTVRPLQSIRPEAKKGTVRPATCPYDPLECTWIRCHALPRRTRAAAFYALRALGSAPDTSSESRTVWKKVLCGDRLSTLLLAGLLVFG